MTGTLHPFKSQYLRTLDLGYNDLHGSIPNNFVSAKNSFQLLSIPQNRLSSSIPEIFTSLTTIDKIDLSSNKLHGTLPDFGKLPLLQHLHLNNNFLVGTIPPSLATSHPIRGNMGDLLETVHLQDNLLSGVLPVQLVDLPKLREFIIHENKLTGRVPADMCSENINAFFFQGISTTNDRDYCEAIACPADTVSSDGSYPCNSCNNELYNPYIGQTRECNSYVNQRDILKKFYESTTMQVGRWNGKNNWNDDGVFLCDFTGITCDANYYVTEINLRNRGLKGVIPGEIGFLQYLEKIDLSDNELTGYLPSDFRWAPLKSLDVSGNEIRGIVPPKLCLQGINGNGFKGDYNCDHIACPAGTYSPSGRRDVNRNHKCEPCPHNNPEVLGYKTCRELGVASGVFGIMIALVTLSVGVTSFIVIRMNRRQRYLKYAGATNELELQQSDAVNRRNQGVVTQQEMNPIAPLRPAHSMAGRNLTMSLPSSPARSQMSRTRNTYIPVPNNFSQESQQEVGLPFPEAGLPKQDTTRKYRAHNSVGSSSRSSESSSSKDMWLDVPNMSRV